MKVRYILFFFGLFLIFNEVYALENFKGKQVISNGTYVINSVLTDYPAFSFSDENVIVDKNIYSYSEAWNINFLNDGYYEIKPYTDNDKYMMVSSDVVLSGSNVLIGEGCDDCFYKWIIKDNDDGTYSIVSNNLKYMDVKYGSSSNGTHIWMYDGNNTLAQKFTFTKINLDSLNNDIYEIKPFINDNLYVSFNNEVAVNGGNVLLSSSGFSNNERWYIKKDENDNDNVYEILSVVDNNFLFDVSGGSVLDKANMQIYKKNNTLAQKFAIVRLEDDSYMFVNIKSGKVLDIAGGNIRDGTNIWQYTMNNTNAQKFKIIKSKKYDYEQKMSNGNYLMYSALNLNKSLRNNSDVIIYDLEGTQNEIISINYVYDGFYTLKNKDKFFTNNNGKVIMSSVNNYDNQLWFLVKNDSYITFISKTDGKVLDIPSANIYNGNKLQTYVSNNTLAQKFYLEEVDTLDFRDGYYNILMGDEVLTSDSDFGMSGSKLGLKENKNKNSQKWYFKNVKDNMYEIKFSSNQNKVLDVSGGSLNDGAIVQTYSSNQTSAQRWHLLKLKNGIYKMISNRSHKCLSFDGNIFKIYSNLSKNRQGFNIVSSSGPLYEKVIDDGYYYIESYVGTNKVLDVAGASTINGTNVWLYSYNNTLAQVWKFKYIGDGMYTIISALNPKRAFSSVNKNVQINKYTEGDNQKWYIRVLDNNKYEIISVLDGLNIDVALASNKDKTNIWMYEGNETLAQSFKINNYSDKKTYKGLDISKWQGNIDFNLLAKENPGFIIMRIGRGIRDLGKDVKFDLYYDKANSYDIPIGVYLYSFASNLNEAKEEANYVITWLEGRHLDLPVFYDMEYSGQLYLGREVLTKIAEEFCSNIILNNYQCGIYANVYWLTNFIDGKELSKNYPIWLAHWTGANNYSSGLLNEYKSGYNLSSYQYWQFTDKGKLAGITENTVDLDFGYDIFD